MIHNHRAVMFGGAQPDGLSKDAYVLDLATMVSEEQRQVIFELSS